MNSFHDEKNKAIIVKLRRTLLELPPCMDAFFRGIAESKMPSTRLAYATDLKLFFMFLTENLSKFRDIPLREFSLEHLKQVDAVDIERFLEHLSYYTAEVNGETKRRQNKGEGKMRKLSAVRAMFKYYFKKELIPANPGERVDMPKLRKKPITILEPDEVARLLDEIERGDKLPTARQQTYNAAFKSRDLALITLFLGTGMRISELTGINLNDLNLSNNTVRVTRKGGDEAILYFSPEVGEALCFYLDTRKDIVPLPGHEQALFLSSQHKRLGSRAIQNLVKKYAAIVAPIKPITPHKLRSTFGTSLYEESGDIYLVAEVLGHADVNTTTKHYARMSEDRKRLAAKAVRLRE